ncbi:MAG: HIT family protein [Neisseriaceae bacterium]|jgi:diadenosine tetraphosphate (Ap4A) HIT family hydrolase
MNSTNDCFFCQRVEEKVILINDVCRVLHVNDETYPGYVQVVVNNHVKELTDLTKENANIVFDTIWLMENKIRKIFCPDKVNIASLGNMVPHLHWHLIPRFVGDKHFPNPIWGNITNPLYKPKEYLIKQQQLFTD